MNFVEGEIFCVDKPLGWTSFNAVKRLRGAVLRRTGARKFKVGHAGTLDPLATGVLIICTGKAYVATMALGATTPSFDLETEIDATYPTAHISRELVESVLKRFTGRIEQVPPAFSACKIDGKRAYSIARKGKEVKLKAKVLIIDELELVDYKPGEITVRVVCSKGTYIRALVRDIGEALGSGAHLTALRRTRVGDVRIDDCQTIDEAVGSIAVAEVEMPED